MKTLGTGIARLTCEGRNKARWAQPTDGFARGTETKRTERPCYLDNKSAGYAGKLDSSHSEK